MRPFGAIRWVCALVLGRLAATPAHAAWDNVFQVCCFGCKSQPAVSGYAPAGCCPQQPAVRRPVRSRPAAPRSTCSALTTSR